MQIIIHNSSMQPIYEQIVEQIKGMVLDGSLKAQTMLPSVRALSKELKISALTVKKAYDHLEQAGFVVTVHGKGSFVAGVSGGVILEEQKKEGEADLEMAIRKGRNCHMTDQEIRELFHLIMEDL